MSRSHRSMHTTRIGAALMVATLGLVSLLGCSSDKSTNPNPNPGAGATTYTGTVAGTGADGKLTITIATSTPAPQNAGYRATGVVTATGTYTPSGGAAIALTGSYDDGANQVGLLSSGNAWAFAGEVTGTRFDGQCTGPAGVTGYWTLVKGGSEVTTIIGTYTSTTMPAGDSGHFNISISGTEVHGNAVTNDGATAVLLDGTYNPTTGDISIVNPAGGSPLATGNYNSGTGHASGQFNDGQGNSGTWQGDRQQ